MFISRQPIFNITKNIYAYKLLFRADEDLNTYSDKNADKLIAGVLDNLLTYGVNKMSEGKRVFITFDETFILKDFYTLLNVDDVIIELAPNIKVTEEILFKIKEIVNAGFMVATRELNSVYENDYLVKEVDIIEIDMSNTDIAIIKDNIKEALLNNKILLAQNVETIEEFELSKMLGFKLFQGYFFSKPEIIEGVVSNSNISPMYFEVLNELNRLEPSYVKITESISKDPELVHKLLYTVNQKINFSEPITSIERAISFLGLKEMTYWITLLLMKSSSSSKPSELLLSTLIRSNFMGDIAYKLKGRREKSEASLLGLLSNLDGFLDKRIGDIIKDLNVSKEIQKGLLLQEGFLGDIYKLIQSYEQGNWEAVTDLMENLNLSESEIKNIYINALEKAGSVVDTLNLK